MRTYRAGDTVEQLCRACKIDRLHTVIAVDGVGAPIRVQCDFCGSQHNSRGMAGAPRRDEPDASRAARPRGDERPPLPLVTERERAGAPGVGALADSLDLELLLRRIIREECGVTPVVPAEKWRDGLLVLRPGSPGLQEKSWPIETFFHKVVMIRNRLRTLEQQVNAMEIPEDAKVRLQAYITACYGSLSSFNLLFADVNDHFKGAGD
ncbi:MAG TPA: hypothetical protein VK911_03275 [Vicinamibacterales bacterium]|nr:hypothetical protein [Vicinamibacterales bacterium]